MKTLNVLGFGLGSLAMMGVTVGLVGCGEEGTTEIVNNNYTSGMEIVDKVSDLPKCTSENAGDQALVKSEGEVRYCVDGEWLNLNEKSLPDTVYVSGGDFSCTTENLADSSGVNIVCNGEVIGTVLNGKDGADGKDGAQGIQGEKGDTGDTGATGAAGADGKDGENGTDGKDGAAGADGKDGVNGTDGKDGTDGVGCSVASSTETTVTIKCGNDTFTMNLNGSSEGGDVAKVDTTYVPELSGVSQKGPFVIGTEVKGYELDGTRSFAQTGRSFTGKINSDDGKFSINSVKLVSTQVLLSATGYYRNEVTGKNSTAPISLYAVTDLSDRKNVNVNLLTHLEYDRVAYKMKNSDGTLKIKAAKKAAQQEILKTVFGIENADFGYSEDLDIFGSSEGDAVLLALSVLLQGNRSEADLTALLTTISKDLEDNGVWDDSAIRDSIAYWAVATDSGNGLKTIRTKVANWQLGTVPNFEKYVRNFYGETLGLGVCGSDSVPFWSTLYYPVKSKLSKPYPQGATLVCHEDNGTGRWLVNTKFSLDTPKKLYLSPSIEYDSLYDERDGLYYKTVEIGSQVWMAENLNFKTEDSRCFGGVEKNCDLLGRLYTWNDAVGACPVGWNLPSSEDWKTLLKYAINEKSALRYTLHSQVGWENSTDTLANKFGFSAIPSGNWDSKYGLYSNLSSGSSKVDNYSFFWSSTADATTADFMFFGSYTAEVQLEASKLDGFSVRCIKNSK